MQEKSFADSENIPHFRSELEKCLSEGDIGVWLSNMLTATAQEFNLEQQTFVVSISKITRIKSTHITSATICWHRWYVQVMIEGSLPNMRKLLMEILASYGVHVQWVLFSPCDAKTNRNEPYYETSLVFPSLPLMEVVEKLSC